MLWRTIFYNIMDKYMMGPGMFIGGRLRLPPPTLHSSSFPCPSSAGVQPAAVAVRVLDPPQKAPRHIHGRQAILAGPKAGQSARLQLER